MIRCSALAQVGLAISALASFSASASASARGNERINVPWMVVEAGDDAKSLRIFVPDGDPCIHPKARVTSSTARRLAIRVTIKKGENCPPNDALVDPTVLSVRLDRKLDGQIISGPEINRRPAGEEQWRYLNDESSNLNDPLSAPNLIGLRGTYALRIARALGVATTLEGRRNRAVVTQMPAAGTSLQPGADQLLLTSSGDAGPLVPAMPVPECEVLPDGTNGCYR